MKKVIFTLAVLVMAFGNAGFAQHKANLKSNATQNVLKHYGVRNETTVVPQVATWKESETDVFRTTYEYDEYDYYLVTEFIEGKEDNTWEPIGMVTYEYDFSGNILEVLGQMWDGSDWMDAAKAVYTYGNDEMTIIYQFWNGNQWVNEVKEVYNYNGDVTTILFWEWSGNTWSSSDLYTYTYSISSIEVLMQYMQGGAWQNEEKDTYALDFEGNVSELLIEQWQNNAWMNVEKTTYNYEGGVFVLKMGQNWVNGAWVDAFRFNYDYVDGNAVHGTCERKDNNSWVPTNRDIEMAYGYNAESVSYYGFEVDMTYVDLTSLNENNQTASFKVYPVPAENEIQIQAEGFQKAEIYSLTGQKLMESLCDRMNVSVLTSGLYVMKVYDREGGCSTQRFVVK